MSTTATDRLRPPTTVNIAFWLFMLVILAHIVTIATFGQTEAAAKAQVANAGGTHGVNVDGLLGATLTAGIVIGALYIVAFVLFAMFMRRGANWARIVLLIVTVLSITGVVGAYGIGAVGVVAGIVAVVLTFLPTATAYFRTVRDRKRGGPAIA